MAVRPSPRTLARPAARPAYRPVVCLDHGLTQGAEVTAVTAPRVEAPVDRPVLALALAAVDHGAHPIPLTVDLTSSPSLQPLPGLLADLLERHQVAPGDVGVKLSARQAMVDPAETAEAVSALRGLGCPVGIAEVGASLGSLRLLDTIELDFAELAVQLVTDMLATPDALAEAAALLGRIHRAGLISVAAGVSTHAQAEWLRDLGCQLGHGLYFGEPGHWLSPSTTHECSTG